MLYLLSTHKNKDDITKTITIKMMDNAATNCSAP